ncbi:MAG TPA: gamma-glutamylcyclotransferase family protein [Gemmatimonadaceae bacterium]|nr:gamma-glutamylcyclotransferase family protein [Gemmatimonadaceae bacterium]
MITHLFVYGTLRAETGHPMAEMLRARARPLGRAAIQGRLFDLGAYPGAVSSEDARDVVHGEMYELELAHAARTLLALDDYEGYDPADPAGSLFVRHEYPVHDTPEPAWVYFFNGSTDGACRIEGGDYLRALAGRAAPSRSAAH